MRSQPTTRFRTELGFSILELMLVLAILTVIMAVVFEQINAVQARYKTEESRLDITQESREFVDQLVRDLHSAGYPSYHLYTLASLPSPAVNSNLVAAGVVAVSATDLWFEGDPDGDGNVDSIRYTLTNNGGYCPCTLSRSDIIKVNNVAPTSQATKYAVDLQNVVNSTGSGTAYPISGITRYGVSNDSYYANFKTAPLFAYYDSNNNLITVPDDLSTSANLTAGITAAANVYRISVVVNVLAASPDIKTGVKPAVTMRSQVRIYNQ